MNITQFFVGISSLGEVKICHLDKDERKYVDLNNKKTSAKTNNNWFNITNSLECDFVPLFPLFTAISKFDRENVRPNRAYLINLLENNYTDLLRVCRCYLESIKNVPEEKRDMYYGLVTEKTYSTHITGHNFRIKTFDELFNINNNNDSWVAEKDGSAFDISKIDDGIMYVWTLKCGDTAQHFLPSIPFCYMKDMSIDDIVAFNKGYLDQIRSWYWYEDDREDALADCSVTGKYFVPKSSLELKYPNIPILTKK